MTRIGFKFKFTWKNLIRYDIHTMLINETHTSPLQEINNLLQIVKLGSLLKYILCYCSTHLLLF